MATMTSCENTLQVKGWHKIYVKSGIQLKFSKTATLGTEESGHCRVRFKTRVIVWTVRQKKQPL